MSSSGPSSNRQDLVQNAILFLNDSKVQSSTLASKISFLESKGLNEAEIQEALSRAPNEVSTTSGEPSFARRSPYDTAAYEPRRYGYDYGVVPSPPRRDWRDVFIMAVISGGVAYGLTALARRYLMPHLQPPSTTSFQQTSQDLTSSYDEAARLLAELSEQTSQLQTSLEQDKERVAKVVEDVEDAVKSVKAGEERWREEMRDMRGEVDSLKDLVPRMMEKHSSNQSSALTDLQSELRSLKTLLQSRQLQSGGTNGTNTPGANGISSTQAAANALLAPKGRGIPAWQLASSNDKKTEGYSVESASGSSSMSGSEVLGSGSEAHHGQEGSTVSVDAT